MSESSSLPSGLYTHSQHTHSVEGPSLPMNLSSCAHGDSASEDMEKGSTQGEVSFFFPHILRVNTSNSTSSSFPPKAKAIRCSHTMKKLQSVHTIGKHPKKIEPTCHFQNHRSQSPPQLQPQPLHDKGWSFLIGFTSLVLVIAPIILFEIWLFVSNTPSEFKTDFPLTSRNFAGMLPIAIVCPWEVAMTHCRPAALSKGAWNCVSLATGFWIGAVAVMVTNRVNVANGN